MYSRPANAGFAFDPDQQPGEAPTAKLTPEYQAKMVKRIEDVKKGIEWDPISTCAPPGHPRWLTEPFLREFIVTPNQTWLINEMVNDIRRIYTDGRDHVPTEDRYPIPNGDSIGFWDGPKLVIHTNQLQSGIYQRQHPDYTDQVETVEIWRKADDKTLTADVWVYDPPALAEPWYVKQSYVKLSDPDKSLRIRYWNCGENQNNAVVQTKEGSTQFRGFTFDKGADAQRAERQAMTRAFTTAVLALGALAVTAVPGLAHHSATMFDDKKTVTVEGVVKEFQYTNPHSWLLGGRDRQGRQGHDVGIRGRGADDAAAAGIRPSDFKAGTKLTITGNPMKDGKPAAIWVDAVRADGKKFNPRAGFAIK